MVLPSIMKSLSPYPPGTCLGLATNNNSYRHRSQFRPDKSNIILSERHEPDTILAPPESGPRAAASTPRGELREDVRCGVHGTVRCGARRHVCRAWPWLFVRVIGYISVPQSFYRFRPSCQRHLYIRQSSLPAGVFPPVRNTVFPSVPAPHRAAHYSLQGNGGCKQAGARY